MDKIFIIFPLIAPITMFFSGFLIARQMRMFENAPLISKLFVEKKWLLSIITGFFISIVFTLLYSATSGFSLGKIVAFLALFILTSGSYYFGLRFGRGNSFSVDKNASTVNPTQSDSFPENVVVDNTINSVKITINSQKRWVLFVMSVFQWVMMSLCILPIASLAIISLLQNYLPKNMGFLVWILVGGLVLYLLYIKFQEALEYVFDQEIVEVDNLSVKIEKYGMGFKSIKEYPAENIKKITPMFSLGGTNIVLQRSPFMNSNMPAFMMWHNHGLKRYRSFGKAIDLADAQRILETIYSKFPQYKG